MKLNKLILTTLLLSTCANPAPAETPCDYESKVNTEYTKKIEKVLEFDKKVYDIEVAIKLALDAKKQGLALSIGLLGNAADVYSQLLIKNIIPEIDMLMFSISNKFCLKSLKYSY